jgi:hypothetical protein
VLRPAGVILTGESVVPASAPDDAQLWYTIDQPVADRQNPLIAFGLTLERWDQELGIWRHVCGQPWRGTTDVDPDDGLPVLPRCTASLVTLGPGRSPRSKRGWRLRGWLELPQPLAVGWRIEIVQPVD